MVAAPLGHYPQNKILYAIYNYAGDQVNIQYSFKQILDRFCHFVRNGGVN